MSAVFHADVSKNGDFEAFLPPALYNSLKRPKTFFLKQMVLKRVYEVPNEVKNLSQSFHFEFPDFSGIQLQAVFLV